MLLQEGVLALILYDDLLTRCLSGNKIVVLVHVCIILFLPMAKP